MRDFTLSDEHRRIQETIREKNQVFKQALRLLDGGRIGIAAWCLGIGRAGAARRGGREPVELEGGSLERG